MGMPRVTNPSKTETVGVSMKPNIIPEKEVENMEKLMRKCGKQGMLLLISFELCEYSTHLLVNKCEL